jgi:hypothetical protein
MYLCVLDGQGRTLLHEDIPARAEDFLRAIAPHKDGLVVACECMFAWYWLADACAAEGLPFVLGHALEMRAIHGTKTKSDKLDSEKIAHLLRAGLLPQAYVYPAAMRATRDLLRRRGYLVRRRAEALTHVQILHGQYDVAAPTGKLRYPANRAGLLDRFDDESVRRALAARVERGAAAGRLWAIESASESTLEDLAAAPGDPDRAARVALVIQGGMTWARQQGGAVAPVGELYDAVAFKAAVLAAWAEARAELEASPAGPEGDDQGDA